MSIPWPVALLAGAGALLSLGITIRAAREKDWLATFTGALLTLLWFGVLIYFTVKGSTG